MEYMDSKMQQRYDAADDAEREKETSAPMIWHVGHPDHVYASEWFIAKLINGAKVVLRALPEEYSYDFKTADETYYKKELVKCWMQFPDSEFIPFEPILVATQACASEPSQE